MSTSRAKRDGFRVLGSGYVLHPPPPFGDGKKVALRTSFPGAVWQNTRVTGDDVPDWKQRVKRCESATTLLVGSKSVMSPMFADYKKDTRWSVAPYTDKFAVTGVTHVIPLRTDTSSAALSDARALAYAAFAKDVRKQTRTWQGGVFAGELVETARMLASPMKGLFTHTRDFIEKGLKAQRKLASKNPKLRGRALKDAFDNWDEGRKALSNGYLEYTFGIRPLINDINDATEAFNAVRNKDVYDSVRFKGTGKAHRVDVYNGPGNSWGLADGYNCKTFARKYAEVYVTGAMRNGNPAGEMPLAQRFGLDLSNVAPTVWELVPFTWLFDYFTNQGNAIDAWSLRFIDFGWLQQTEVEGVLTTLGDFRVNEAGNPGDYSLHLYRKGYSSYRYVTRSPRDNDFATPFMFKLPGYPQQTWNIAAVASSLAGLLSGTGRHLRI